MSVYGVNTDTWTETQITYNNAPAASTSALTSVGISDTSIYYDFDVTNYVNAQSSGDTIVSFLLKDTSNQANLVVFNSKENSQNKPQ